MIHLQIRNYRFRNICKFSLLAYKITVPSPQNLFKQTQWHQPQEVTGSEPSAANGLLLKQTRPPNLTLWSHQNVVS